LSWEHPMIIIFVLRPHSPLLSFISTTYITLICIISSFFSVVC
jgi:hypothetical protein